jgi:predicted SAM-dependent methyltransferase
MRNSIKNFKQEILSLDIGAGENPKGSINVDIRPLPTIDVVCHALYLPFRSEVFDKVFLKHVIEHFRYKDAFNLLRECNRVLKLRGEIEIWTPNFQALGVLKTWIFGNVNERDPQCWPHYSWALKIMKRMYT